MKVVSGRQYVCRNGDIVTVSNNSDGWLDGLPFICEVTQWASIAGGLGLGGAPKYTVNEDGLVYPTCEKPGGWCNQDLVQPYN